MANASLGVMDPGDPPAVVTTAKFMLSARKFREPKEGPLPPAENGAFLSKAISNAAGEEYMAGNRRRSLSQQEVLSLIKVEYNVDLYRWSKQPTNGTIVDVAFPGHQIRNLTTPLVLQVKRQSNALAAIDPRGKGCTWFNQTYGSWRSSGVFLLGVSMNATQAHIHCASRHLTSFTTNGKVYPPNLAILGVHPNVLRHYSNRDAWVPYFVGSILFLSLLKIIHCELARRQARQQYEVWRAAAHTFLRFGTINAVSCMIRHNVESGRWSLLKVMTYRLRCDWPLHPGMAAFVVDTCTLYYFIFCVSSCPYACSFLQ
jgi:hypothetical protein